MFLRFHVFHDIYYFRLSYFDLIIDFGVVNLMMGS